jgi:hypothetical protein
MVSVNNSIEKKKARAEARRELANLDSLELTNLLLDTTDAKTLSVMTASLSVARKRGERETARARSETRRTAS